jgi:hypothetical protein
LRGLELTTLDVAPAQSSHPFATSFEDVAQSLERIPQLFFEPDGSFAVTRLRDKDRLQLDGNLFDRDGRLLYVDLKGTCTDEDFDRLLGALGWPHVPLMFQLAREAVCLGEDEFRRYAAAKG